MATVVAPDWQGSIEDLARIAQTVLTHDHRTSEQSELVLRIVRDYQNRGIISSPQRVGRKAVYHQRHVLELISARILLADGWKLGKIAELIDHMSNGELIALVEGSHSPTSEDDGSMRSDINDGGRDDASNVAHVEYSAQVQDAPPDFAGKATFLAAEQASLQSARLALDLADEPPMPKQRTFFELTRWAHLTIDSDKAAGITDREAIQLGRLVRATLITYAAQRK